MIIFPVDFILGGDADGEHDAPHGNVAQDLGQGDLGVGEQKVHS